MVILNHRFEDDDPGNALCVFLFFQDESSTLQLLKKQLSLEQAIEDYAETIGLLSQQCRQLLELGHSDRCVFD